MAEIPSDIASSAAQAGIRARQAVGDRESHRAAQANTSERQVKAVDQAGSSVDTDDLDTQVFADAEGTGSEGRPFEDEAPEQDDDDAPSREETSGLTRDENGKLHVDLEA